MPRPKTEEVVRTALGELDPSQRDDGACVQLYHFVGRYVDRTHDEQCRCAENKHGDGDTHPPV